MTANTLFKPALLLLSLPFVAGALGACASAEDPIEEPLPATTTSGNGGNTPTSTTGSGGQGGSGGEDLGPCGQDCSLIDTGNPCLVAVCNTGQAPGPVNDCVVVPNEGASCDDGQFCTVDDACDDSGACVGGPPNDCGLSGAACEEVVCNEDDDICELAPVANGTSCDSGNLCVNGATCLNGLCQGGQPESCFLEPVPSDCYVSVCNPQNGQCEPIVGNDGQSCVDINDLCTDNKFCDNGACVGGGPKDCSGAATECEVGVCDPNTGTCGPTPGMAGQACPSAADECNTGECDVNGTCAPVPLASGTSCPSAVDECNAGECDGSGTCTAVPLLAGTACLSAADQCNTAACDGNGTCGAIPVADGTQCNDADACTATDECTAGVCGGVAVTTCSQTADGCCPGNCTAANDVDCACSNTSLAATSAATSGWEGYMFDVEAINEVTITSLDSDFDPGADQVELYYRIGGYSGFDTDASAWTLLGSGTLATPGTDTPIPIPINVTVPAGQTIAFYITCPNASTTSNGHNYVLNQTEGTITHSDANINVLAGRGKYHLFGSSFANRGFPGRVNYEVCGQP